MQQIIDSAKNSLGCYSGVKTIPYYYSQRLRRKLEILAISKAAIVEAPSGYGKTTVMRDYLKDAGKHGEKVYWFTAVDEAPTAMYRRLCREIEKIDSRAGARLKKIDFPNAFTLGEVCDAFRAIECTGKTWLVIDDFHFLQGAIPIQVLAALLCHSRDELRIVVVTQMLGSEFLSAVAGCGMPHIKAADLQWNAGDIRKYFSMAGAEISHDVATEVEKFTNGWVIAVHLQLCALRETGGLSDNAVYQLMEHLIWNKMTAEQQKFFMLASPLKTCSVSQLCALLDCKVLPNYAIRTLSIPFVRYISELNQYEAHTILHELITTKRRECGEAFDKDCLRKVGDLCRDEGKMALALDYYAQISDYESILSLHLAEYTFTELGDRTFYDIAVEISQNCPKEIRCGHPLSMLYVAWAIRLMDDGNPEFARLMDELDSVLPEKGHLRAEWLLLSVYLHYPNLEKMVPIVQKAAQMFGGHGSEVILPSAPWAFYEYLQLTAFHINVGHADREADMLEEFLNTYSSLTGGHGHGADALYRAELAFYRCETAKAEVFAYKAVFLAEGKNQKIIQVGAARLLSSIAMLKANAGGWKLALGAVEHAAHGSAQNTSVFRTLLDVVRGTLLSELRDFGRIPEWLKKPDFTSERLPKSIKKNAMAVHVLYLISQGEFAKLVGFCEARTTEGYTIFSECFHNFLLAVGLFSLGEKEQALKCVEVSAKKALPDGMLHYFAGFSCYIYELVHEIIEREYPEFLSKFHEYSEQLEKGWKVLHSALVAPDVPSGLTEREREIAQLAAEGMRNNEIAEMLFVSENTVRAHLRAIYQKLDIDRRAKIAKVLK